MSPSPKFDMQKALTDMEGRIRQDIKNASDAALKAAETAQARADTAHDTGIQLDGRVTSLEEKAGWIRGGFGAGIIGAAGFIWHILASRG